MAITQEITGKFERGKKFDRLAQRGAVSKMAPLYLKGEGQDAEE